MQQVQAAPDGAAKRRATRPQRAFHDDSTLNDAPPPAAAAPSSAEVRQGALSMGSDKGAVWWQQPHVFMAAGAAVCFLLLIYVVSR